MINHWLNALAAKTMQTAPSILVTVAKSMGSVPRLAGAKMLVTSTHSIDTIGGGHLEMRAIEIARAMLAQPAGTLDAERHLERLSLGPSLGQCCGGAVYLAFERIDEQGLHTMHCLAQHIQQRQASWRFISLDTTLAASLLDAAGEHLSGAPLPSALAQKIDAALPCQLHTDAAGKLWLIDACLPSKARLMLFGAGHVGAAIVRALADLPCQIIWVDEREDMFPSTLPHNVSIEATDAPEALIAAAEAGMSFLVLTHSHALDQHLTEHILRRNDFAWFGLIGSQTKRKQFEHRLRQRSISEHSLNKMVCPIGLPGISGKEPAIIAASVAAQLLQVWEAEQQNMQKTVLDKYSAIA